jgi:hypothetical protein
MSSRKHPHAAQVRPLQEITKKVGSPSFVIHRIGSEDKIGTTHHYEERWEGEMKFDGRGSWRLSTCLAFTAQPGIGPHTTGK